MEEEEVCYVGQIGQGKTAQHYTSNGSNTEYPENSLRRLSILPRAAHSLTKVPARTAFHQDCPFKAISHSLSPHSVSFQTPFAQPFSQLCTFVIKYRTATNRLGPLLDAALTMEYLGLVCLISPHPNKAIVRKALTDRFWLPVGTFRLKAIVIDYSGQSGQQTFCEWVSNCLILSPSLCS